MTAGMATALTLYLCVAGPGALFLWLRTKGSPGKTIREIASVLEPPTFVEEEDEDALHIVERRLIEARRKKVFRRRPSALPSTPLINRSGRRVLVASNRVPELIQEGFQRAYE